MTNRYPNNPADEKDIKKAKYQAGHIGAALEYLDRLGHILRQELTAATEDPSWYDDNRDTARALADLLARHHQDETLHHGPAAQVVGSLANMGADQAETECWQDMTDGPGETNGAWIEGRQWIGKAGIVEAARQAGATAAAANIDNPWNRFEPLGGADGEWFASRTHPDYCEAVGVLCRRLNIDPAGTAAP